MKNNSNVTGSNAYEDSDKEKRKILIEIKLEKDIVQSQLEEFLWSPLKIPASSEQGVKEGQKLPAPAAFCFQGTFHER